MMSALLEDLRAEVDAVRAADPGSSRARDAYERWFAQSCAEGRRPDSLERGSRNESERFFARVIQGPDGHCYWEGSDKFRRNDGRWRVPRKWWWEHRHGPVLDRSAVKPTCGEPHCITVDHQRLVSWSEIKQRFTDEQCIGALQVAAMRLGRAPIRDEYVAMRLKPSAEGLRLRYSSWSRALQAAGLEPSRPGSSFVQVWSDEQCLNALRAHHERLGFVPSGAWWERTKQQPSYSTFRRRFKSWGRALKEAGF